MQSSCFKNNGGQLTQNRHLYTIHGLCSNQQPQSDREPRAVIYFNKNLLDIAYVTPILLPFSDVTAIQITAPDSKPALILNIYNPCDGSIIPQLHNHLRKELNVRDYETIIMAGDFNCHHPLWNPKQYTRH